MDGFFFYRPHQRMQDQSGIAREYSPTDGIDRYFK